MLLAALVIWATLIDDRGGEGGGEGAEAARIVSADELAEIAASRPGPLYWAGPRRGAELEYSAEPGGRALPRARAARAQSARVGHPSGRMANMLDKDRRCP